MRLYTPFFGVEADAALSNFAANSAGALNLLAVSRLGKRGLLWEVNPRQSGDGAIYTVVLTLIRDGW
jgi:hypothetical protein